MNHERKDLPIDEALPGMMLADDVREAQGAVLLPKGATLSESALASLRRRGVAVLPVLVESYESRLSPEEEAARRERVEQRLQYIFRRAGDGDPVRQLREQVSLYHLENAR